ncbi:MAG: 23S rRNA (uracil(1939)-C(5))-methyltransferase RlmD [Elusimicrobia bacterium]|nr:23S rRNA (uracil(1939)-C(5))-methyltransferase RlmD [Elusimicrobiota bacterium]
MEKLIVRVERMAPEGEAIARAEGASRVIFVSHGVPGDRLEVELIEAKSSYAKARIVKILEPGPERILPPCPLHFDPSRPVPACGGCDWQQFGYPAQLKHKREVILDALRRIGKLPDVPVLETIPSPQDWAYRNKVQIPFGRLGKGPGSKVLAGFYAPGSHRIVDFSACPVQPELAVKIALKIKQLAQRWDWPVYDEDSAHGWLRHLLVRTNGQGKALAALVTKGLEFRQRDEFIQELRGAFPEIISLHQNIQPLKTSVILGQQWKHLWGAKQIEEKIGKFSFLVSPGAFLQVNTGASEKLYDTALSFLREGSPNFKMGLDLYCGAGTLTLWAAQGLPRIIGIEENQQAIRDAWANAERNNVKNVRFTASRAEAALPRLKKEFPDRVAALADPPRAGLSHPVLKALTAREIRRLVYVSCNPATFARDASFLCHSGFKLLKVQPVDLFPQTSHVELVGLLDRSQ